MSVAPSINLIDSSDARVAAWINSRPTFDHSDLQDPANVEKLTSMDLSMNSIAQYVFDITSTVKFRDFLLSIRPIAPWCRSLRSAPLTREWLNICGESECADYENDLIDECLADIEAGVPQDKARNNLPMNLATTYTVAMDHRTVVSLVKSMMATMPRLFCTYGQLFLQAIGKDVRWLEQQKIKPLHDSYVMTENELLGARTFGGASAIAGEMIYSAFTTTYSHAAQLIRMHHAKVKTSIWTEAVTAGLTDGDKQGDSVLVAVYADRATWLNMVALRSHWFAEWNSWSSVVAPTLKQMSVLEAWNFLPNGNGKKDPYERDMMSRIHMEELNLPCPIMCEWPALVKARIIENGRSYIANLYEMFVLDNLIPDNPDNEYRRLFLSTLDAKMSNHDDPLWPRYERLFNLLVSSGALKLD